MTLTAEIHKNEESQSNTYTCKVYNACYEMLRTQVRLEPKGKGKKYSIGYQLLPRVIDGRKVIDQGSKKLLAELVLSATQASRSKAENIINRHLARMGRKDRIKSAEIYSLDK